MCAGAPINGKRVCSVGTRTGEWTGSVPVQHRVQREASPSTGLQAGQHGGQGLRRQLGALGLVLVWGKTPHYRRAAPLQEGYTRLDEGLLEDTTAF